MLRHNKTSHLQEIRKRFISYPLIRGILTVILFSKKQKTKKNSPRRKGSSLNDEVAFSGVYRIENINSIASAIKKAVATFAVFFSRSARITWYIAPTSSNLSYRSLIKYYHIIFCLTRWFCLNLQIFFSNIKISGTIPLPVSPISLQLSLSKQ